MAIIKPDGSLESEDGLSDPIHETKDWKQQFFQEVARKMKKKKGLSRPHISEDLPTNTLERGWEK